MAYRIKENQPERSRSSAESRPASLDEHRRSKPRSIERLTSLDAFRGFIMILLAANGFGIYALSRTEASSELWTLIDRDWFEQVAFHFEHPPWQSNFAIGSMTAGIGNPWTLWKVSFWDLIQPSFMFMVGAAMPFSYARRERDGQSAFVRGLHAFVRAVVLVLLGVFLYSKGYESTNWIFPNVLAQIGLGYFFVYLIAGFPTWGQWVSFAVILVGTTLAIQFIPLKSEFNPDAVKASYDRGEILEEPYQQWSKNWNIFHEFDVWFLNKFPRPEADNGDPIPFEYNNGGYTTLNFVPSMATMLLGVFCGQFILTSPKKFKTFLVLFLAGILCTSLGVAAGATCCPIIKKIWTPAWVLFSGGYVILMLSLFYLLFDLIPFKPLAFPLVVIGMNSILVYMMGQLLKPWIYREVVMKHFDWAVENLLGWIAQLSGLKYTGSEMLELFGPVVYSTSVALFIWLTCYWLYRRRLFVRI